MSAELAICIKVNGLAAPGTSPKSSTSAVYTNALVGQWRENRAPHGTQVSDTADQWTCGNDSLIGPQTKQEFDRISPVQYVGTMSMVFLSHVSSRSHCSWGRNGVSGRVRACPRRLPLYRFWPLVSRSGWYSRGRGDSTCCGTRPFCCGRSVLTQHTKSNI